MTSNIGNNVGFSFPSTNQILSMPIQENEKLADKKQRILTELAAIENGISLFDWLNPERNNLQTSVTDVPCSVELLSVDRTLKRRHVDVDSASNALSEIIEDIGTHPTPMPYKISRPDLTCDAIVNHAKVFFAQLHRMKQARIGLSTPFGVIQHNNADYTSIPQEQPAEEETPATKRVHPFFPDIKGIRPLLGLMKEQLGEFPNYIKNPPDDDECDELRRAIDDPKILEKHLLDICGSSSDDEFNPDQPLEPVRPPVSYNLPTLQRL